MATMTVTCPACKHDHTVPLDTEWVTCAGCGIPILITGVDFNPEQLDLFAKPGHFNNQGDYLWPDGGKTLKDGRHVSTIRVYCQDVDDAPAKVVHEWAKENGVQVVRSAAESIADCMFFRIIHGNVELPKWASRQNGYTFVL